MLLELFLVGHDLRCLWCEQEMDMVDFRDLCMGWEGETGMGNA